MTTPTVKPGLLRLVLALLVVFFHLSKFTFLGEFAVDSFFILSGYWISLMFTHKYSKKEDTLKVFYVSRLWRLLPVFYIFSILGAIMLLLVSGNLSGQYNLIQSLRDKGLFWLSNTTILAYNFSKWQILVPAWSLDIEMQFYLLFPFLFYLVRKNKQTLLLLTALSFLASMTTFLVFYKSMVNVTVIAYLYLFLLGMILYKTDIRFTPARQTTGGLLFLGVLALQFILPRLYSSPVFNSRYFYKVLTLLSLLFTLPLLAGSVKVKSNARDKFFGEMSYLVYLSHWVWLIPYNALIYNLTNKTMRIPYILLFLLATFGSAVAVYYLVDRKSEKYRHKWIKGQPDKTPSPALLLKPRVIIPHLPLV
jgi:peptidoglycan/LPS O-acetylase OafA/YrhL